MAVATPTTNREQVAEKLREWRSPSNAAPELPDELKVHAEAIAEFLRQRHAESTTVRDLVKGPPTAVEWGEQNFYIPTDTGRPRLIRFMPHQRTILALFFDPVFAAKLNCNPNFQTLVYSTVKKSGKTAIAALVARWITETWGSHAEVYSLANDLEQARGRIYAAAVASIELDPRYRRSDKGIKDVWRIIETNRQASYLPTHSTLRAVSADYKGEAGSNPVATFWSELWGYSTEASQRLWDELTPVPTRPRSIRYVETYAGYDGESSILNDLEDRVKKEGRRLTYGELTEELGLSWPFPHDQPVPFFVHEPSRTLAYWDDGEHARRMPWQTPEYYRAQAAELRPQAFERLHLNFRVSATDEFIPIEWWDRLNDPTMPALTHTDPVVLGADASVSGDCTAISLVSRDPRRATDLLHRGGRIWKPAPGKPLDYSVTIEPEIRRLCTGHIHPHYEDCKSHSKLAALGVCVPTTPYNVVEVAYDEYQLHDLMSRLRNEGVAWCRKFSQMGERAVADKALYDHIRDLSIHHMGDPDLREHIRNCGAKIPDDDNTKLRLIKRSPKANIDYTVATSMAAHECLRLNL